MSLADWISVLSILAQFTAFGFGAVFSFKAVKAHCSGNKEDRVWYMLVALMLMTACK